MLAGKSILIADDDRHLVSFLTLRCQALGLVVQGAFDCVTALTQIHTHYPDVVCLDVNLPGGNGLSLCEMLCTDDRMADIPKIILTGRSDPDTIRRCHTMCAYYVEKANNVWERMSPLLHDILDKPADGKAPRPVHFDLSCNE
jgi:DNA-binding response OmpR family regulator